MELRKLRKILLWCLVLPFLPILPALLFPAYDLVFYWIAIILAVVYAIVSRMLWRCPYCRDSLGRIDERKTYCPHCGKYLDLDGDR